MILAIDPGTIESGYVIVSKGLRIVEAGKVWNHQILDIISNNAGHSNTCLIESMQSYGKPVGQSVFNTCIWIGRFIQSSIHCGVVEYGLIPRKSYAHALCRNTRAVSDAMIRKELEQRFGGYKPGQPLEKLVGSSDVRSAFAMAVYFTDCNRGRGVK